MDNDNWRKNIKIPLSRIKPRILRPKTKSLLIALLLVITLSSISLVALASAQGGESKEIYIRAFRYGYDPSTITINKGDHVTLVVEAQDSIHGLYIEGYDIKVEDITPGSPVKIEFTANYVGTFRIRCATLCGALHPFMISQLTVQPNYSLMGAFFSVTAITAVFGGYLMVKGGGNSVAAPSWRFDLLKIPIVKRLVKMRALQSLLQVPNALIFTMIILTGLIGVPLGAKNMSIVFTWILWWVALMIVLVPFAGRAWCSMCPIVLPAEPLQRGFWRRKARPFTLGRQWPKKLANMWPQNFLFMATSLFIVVLVTQPMATGLLVVLLIGGAIGISLIFSRRTFCRYLCPVSGFIGLYSMFASLELRVKDRAKCLKHTGKDCFKGNEKGYGCPWFEFPQTLEKNTYCGLCTECVKTCTEDNIAINLRPFGHDLLAIKHRRFDEAWKSIMMLSLAILYSVVLMGPWAWLKSWGYYWEPVGGAGLTQHVLYALLILSLVFGLVPALHLFASWASKLASGEKKVSVRQLFTSYAYAYVPLGLMLWIGFSITLLLVNWAYIAVTLSDPFGFGWNLLGTRYAVWAPISWPLPYIQMALSLIGLTLSLNVGYGISRQIFPEEKRAVRALLPVALFMLGATMLYLWMYV